MFGHTFYHKSLRKYVTLFGTLFNDVYINRVRTNGTPAETLKIPITYGPKTKTLLRLDADPLLNRPFEINVPRMAFEMTGINYDPSRKLVTTNRGYVKSNPNDDQIKYLYNPVPYNIDFSLYVTVKNAEDGTRILEQILPFFTPEWTTTVNLVPDMDVKLDIPVIINSVTSEDTYEGEVSERRFIIWTLNFTMKGYIFGPVKKSASIIKTSRTNFYADTTEGASGLEFVELVPGLQANGAPTTDPDNTLNPSLIDIDDDWAYITVKGPIQNE